MTELTRRALGAGFLATPALWLPCPILAQEGCPTLVTLRDQAVAQRAQVPVWLASTLPTLLPEVDARLVQLRGDLDAAEEAADAQAMDALLSAVNVAGATAFLFLGVSVLGPGGLIVGSIAWAGTMMLAGALLAPQPESAVVFMGEFGADRAGVVLEAMKEPQWALSTRSAEVASAAGAALQWATLVYGIFKTGSSVEAYRELLGARDAARERLDAYRASLVEWQDAQAAAAMRDGALLYLAEDLDDALAQSGCGGIGLP